MLPFQHPPLPDPTDPSAAHFADTNGANLISYLQQLAREKNVAIPAFVLPREYLVPCGRLRMHALEYGDPAATPVVFAHPGRLNAHSWDLISLGLQDRFRCISIDLAGHGDSDRAPGMDYRLVKCIEDFDAFLDAMKLERVFLVGCSQGGLQLLAYALHRPERVLGIALLDTGPEIDQRGVVRQGNELAEFRTFASFDEIVAAALHGRTSRNLDKLRFSLSQNVRQLPDGKWTWKFDIDYRKTKGPGTLVVELRKMMERAPLLTCPVRVLHGVDSDVLLADGAKRTADAFARGSWATVPDSRHLLHHENPNFIIDELGRFLSDATPRGQ